MLPQNKFPCPYCKGQGGVSECEIWYDCVVCNSNGMIVVDSSEHDSIKQNAKHRSRQARNN
jgi:RecJ-like exonuclease